MSCCCEKIYQFCQPMNVCADPAAELKTGILAAAAGEHILVLMFLDTEFRIHATFLLGAELIFPMVELNEGYTFTGYILGPDGEKLPFTKDLVEYDCLAFETIVSRNINEPEEPIA